MNSQLWSWIGACSVGSSHIKAGSGCQDAAGCLEFSAIDGHPLLAIVSDGAGTAEFGAIGSQIIVKKFARNLLNFFRENGKAEGINEESVRDWLDDIRDHLAVAANARATSRRSLAATLVAAIALNNRVVVCHVGDGACAIRAEGQQDWLVPSWPSHGEYASSTYFLTDDPEPNLRVSSVEGRFVEIAVFSDGLERLALDFINNVPYGPFLNPMFARLADLKPGRNRPLSAKLRQFLDSANVVERTDDDKSLVLARRTISA